MEPNGALLIKNMKGRGIPVMRGGGARSEGLQGSLHYSGKQIVHYFERLGDSPSREILRSNALNTQPFREAISKCPVSARVVVGYLSSLLLESALTRTRFLTFLQWSATRPLASRVVPLLRVGIEVLRNWSQILTRVITS